MYSNIKSKYILGIIFDILQEGKKLEIIRHNKRLQNTFGITLETYKNYKIVEIEIFVGKTYKLDKDIRLYFIKYNERDEPYFHIYFDDKPEEVKRNYIKWDEKVKKVKIIIEGRVKSFLELFYQCYYVKGITIIKYNRKDLTKFTHMFYECAELINLDISKLKTLNATNINGMFRECNNLMNLDLSNISTVKVKDMSNLFKLCNKLRYLNLNSFDTSNVKHMTGMFYGCSNLEEIQLSNFVTRNVIDMEEMFYYCSKLRVLDISHFDFINVKTMKSMFLGISEDLREIVTVQNKGLKSEAFIK